MALDSYEKSVFNYFGIKGIKELIGLKLLKKVHYKDKLEVAVHIMKETYGISSSKTYIVMPDFLEEQFERLLPKRLKPLKVKVKCVSGRYYHIGCVSKA
jgi:GTP cyclohydrolase FolE2